MIDLLELLVMCKCLALVSTCLAPVLVTYTCAVLALVTLSPALVTCKYMHKKSSHIWIAYV